MKALKLLERIAYKRGIRRIEMRISVKNTQRVRVAEKAGYVQEARLQKGF